MRLAQWYKIISDDKLYSVCYEYDGDNVLYRVHSLAHWNSGFDHVFKTEDDFKVWLESHSEKIFAFVKGRLI